MAVENLIVRVTEPSGRAFYYTLQEGQSVRLAELLKSMGTAHGEVIPHLVAGPPTGDEHNTPKAPVVPPSPHAAPPKPVVEPPKAAAPNHKAPVEHPTHHKK